MPGSTASDSAEAARAAAAERTARERALRRTQGTPLWELVLGFLVAGFAIHRGGAAAFAWLDGPSILAAGFAAETLAALATATGLWTGARWARGAVLVLGVTVAAMAILQVSLLGAAAIPFAASRVAVAAIGAGALWAVLRREDGSAREPRAR